MTLDSEERMLEDILGYFDKLCSKVEENLWLLEGLDWFPISKESASNLEWFLSKEKYEKLFFKWTRKSYVTWIWVQVLGVSMYLDV